MPETWLKFPMHQGDSISGYFNGTGKYCDHLFLRRFGTYQTKADAVGKLVLPSGDTQRFKYNGKELDRMHGLDWYDYGARHMDGMRFTTIVEVMYWRRNK